MAGDEDNPYLPPEVEETSPPADQIIDDAEIARGGYRPVQAEAPPADQIISDEEFNKGGHRPVQAEGPPADQIITDDDIKKGGYRPVTDDAEFDLLFPKKDKRGVVKRAADWVATQIPESWRAWHPLVRNDAATRAPQDIYGTEPIGLPRTPGGLSATAGPTVTSTVPVQDIPAPETSKAVDQAALTVAKRAGEATLEPLRAGWEGVKKTVIPPTDPRAYLGPAGAWRSFKETGLTLLNPVETVIGTVMAPVESVLASGIGTAQRKVQEAIASGVEFIDPTLAAVLRKNIPTSQQAYETARPGASAALMAIPAGRGFPRHPEVSAGAAAPPIPPTSDWARTPNWLTSPRPSEPVPTTGRRASTWTGPPANIPEAPPPAQGTMPFGEENLPFTARPPVDAIQRQPLQPTIGGVGQPPGRLPLEPGVRPPLEPTGRPRQGELPLEPAPRLNREGQYEAPLPERHGTPGAQYAAGTAEAQAPPAGRTQPPNSRRFSKDYTPTEGAPGVNIGADPTLTHVFQQNEPRGPHGQALEREFPRIPNAAEQARPILDPAARRPEPPRIPETTQGVMTEPPVPQGMTRIYRGAASPPGWVATDPKVAGRFGRVFHTDIPDAHFEHFRPGNVKGEFITDHPVFRDRMRPTEPVPLEPVRPRVEPSTSELDAAITRATAEPAPVQTVGDRLKTQVAEERAINERLKADAAARAAGPPRQAMARIPNDYYEQVPLEQRMRGTGESHPGYRWQVIDRQTGKVMGEYANRRRASTRQDRLDNDYGGYRYRVEPVKTEPSQEMVRRDVTERGRSGRPIKTEPIPIGTEQAILERGAEKATGPKLPPEQAPPERQAMAREGEKPGKIVTHDGAVFTGVTQDAAAVNAMAAGYRRHQLFDEAGNRYRAPKAVEAPKPVAEAPKPAAEAPKPAAAAPETLTPTGGGEPAPAVRERKPREDLVEHTTEGHKEAFKAAEKTDDMLHQLSADPAGRQYRYYDMVKDAVKNHPELKTEAGGEKLHDAIVSGKYENVPDNIKRGYEQVKDELGPEIKALRKELADRGKIERVPDDPRYVHRLMKRPSEGFADPFSDIRGSLPGMRDPSSVKELAFRGAENRNGERITLSGRGDDIAVMRDGKVVEYILNPNETGPLKTGDKVNFRNEQYTVDRGLEHEIERDARHEPTKPGAEGAPVEYHKNPIASLVAEHNELTQLKAYHDWLDNFKSADSPFKKFMTKDPEIAAKRGWLKVEGFKDLEGIYLHPDLQQAIHNNFEPGLVSGGANPLIRAMRAINQFAVRSMFWNPVPHALNAQMHYLVGRGWQLLPWRHPLNFFKSHIEGFNAAINQTELLQDLNKAGASFVMSKIDRQNLLPTVGKFLADDLKANPARWEEVVRKFGITENLGAGGLVKLTRAVYDGAQRVLWTYGDALMASRIRELELNGMSRADAIDHAARHMPDYRLPLKFLGSKTATRLMSDQTLSVFGRYHMGMVNSLVTMASETLGRGATMAQRWDALGNIAALGMLGLVVKPMMDSLVQWVTGNKQAENRARGPLAPLQHAYDLYQGKTDPGKVFSGMATMSPVIKMAIENPLTGANLNLFTGKKIVEPQSPVFRQAGQTSEYFIRNTLSPYATFAPTVQPGVSKGATLEELGKQIFDVKVPTAAQIKGQQYGQTKLREDALKRYKRPQGLIEYGVKQLERQFK